VKEASFAYRVTTKELLLYVAHLLDKARVLVLDEYHVVKGPHRSPARRRPRERHLMPRAKPRTRPQLIAGALQHTQRGQTARATIDLRITRKTGTCA
jgi:hypothetical protein